MTQDVSQVKAYARHKTRWLLLFGMVALASTSVWVWKGVLEHHLLLKRYGIVEQGKIYRSGQISSNLIEKFLERRDIKVIVDLTTDDANNTDQKGEAQAAAELGIEIVKLPLGGNGTGDINHYAQAIIAIVQAGRQSKPVLVHCVAGTQRTGGVIACYRLLVQKKDPALVLDEMKRYGFRPKSNPALLPYINGNMAELSLLLKQAAVIDEIPNPLPHLPQN